MLRIIKWIYVSFWERVDIRKGPSTGTHMRRHDRDGWSQPVSGITKYDSLRRIRIRSSRPFSLRTMSALVAHAFVPKFNVDIFMDSKNILTTRVRDIKMVAIY